MRVFFKNIVSGIVFWAIMFVLVSVFLEAYNQFDWAKILISISSGIIAILLVHCLKIEKTRQAFILSLTWLFIGLILDYFITMKFNEQIFNSIYLWFSYGLMFISPLVYVKLIKKKSLWKK
jgi:phosphatidylserine synthase